VFSATNILVGIITGVFGLAYFVNGKKQSKTIFLITGIVLMVYPYLFSNTIVLIIIGVILLPLPFVFRE